MIKTDPEKRFWSKVEKTDTCWLWKAGKDPFGYGAHWFNGKKVNAHRYSYQICVGEVPSGLVLDHLCRVPACVNPKHLEPVTQKENVLRGVGITAINAKKTHCKNGHDISPGNYYYRDGFRKCKTCVKKWSSDYEKYGRKTIDK